METLGHFAFGGLLSLGILYLYSPMRFRNPRYRGCSLLGGVWGTLPHLFGPIESPTVLGWVMTAEQKHALFNTQSADIFFFFYSINIYDKTVFWPEHGPALEPYCSLLLGIAYILLLVAGTKLTLKRSSTKEF